MPVERGGVDYPVLVKGDFDKRLLVLRDRLRQVRQASAELRVGLKRTKDQSKNLFGSMEKDIIQINKALNTMRVVNDRSQKDLEKTARETRGEVERLNKAYIALARSSGLANRGGSRVIDQRTSALARQRRETSLLSGSSFTLFGTLTKLFAVFGAFRVIDAIGDSIRRVVGSLVDVSAKAEQARIAFTSLFLATGTIRSPLGNTVDDAGRLALATQEAVRQQRLLQVDALRTAATFDELFQAFQNALAPGLNAGLLPDQIREITVRISQAAAALGLSQNQLAEEVRSLFTGNINPRNTRIATALGITSEDIRNAQKEAGGLFAFLQNRFDAFSQIERDALGTFNVLVANIGQAFQQLSITEGAVFFQAIKDILVEIQGALFTVTDQGAKFSAEATGVFETIFSAAQNVLGTLQEVRQSLTLDTALNSFQGVIGAIQRTFQTLILFAGGVVRGISQVVNFASEVSRFVKEVLRIEGVGSSLASEFGRLLVIFTAIGASVLGTQAGIFLITKGLALAKTLTLAIGKGMLLLTSPISTIVLLVGGLIFFFKDLSREILGIELSFEQFATVLSVAVPAAAKIGFNRAIAFALKFFVQPLNTAFLEVSRFLSVGVLGVLEKAVRLAAKVTPGNFLNDIADSLEDVGDNLDATFDKQAAGVEGIIKGATAKADKAAKDLEEALQFDLAEILGSESDGVITDQVNGIFGRIQSFFDGGSIDLSGALGFDGASKEADAFIESLDAIRPIITGTSDAFKTQSEEIRKTLLTTQELAGEQSRISRFLLIEGDLRRQIDTLNRGVVDAQRQTFQLTQQRVQQEQNLLTLKSRESAISRGILGQDQQSFSQAVALGRERLRLAQELAGAEVAVEAARTAAQRAEVSGDSARTSGALQELTARTAALARIEGQFAAITARIQNLNVAEGTGQAAANLLQVQGQIAAAQEEINTLKTQEQVIGETILRQNLIAVAGDVQERRAQIVAENSALQGQVDLQTRLNSIRLNSPLNSGAEQASLIASEELRLAEEQFRVQVRANEQKREFLQLQIQQAERLGDTRLAAVFEQQFTDEIKNSSLALELQIMQLEQLRNEIRLANLEIERPVAFGAAEAFVEFKENATDTVGFIQDLTTQGLNDLANVGSEGLKSAFGIGDREDLKASIDRFFSNFLNSFIGFLTQIAITYALITVIPGLREFIQLFAGLQSAGGGLNEGGAVSPFFNAPGRAEGGPTSPSIPGGGAIRPSVPKMPPPPGIHPKDNRPIWAGVGEFIINGGESARLGLNRLSALNSGRYDLGLLDMALGRSSARRSRPGNGYQSGGGVGTISQTGRDASGAIRSAMADLSSGPNKPIVAVVESSRESMNRQIKGGGARALSEFNRRNRSTN